MIRGPLGVGKTTVARLLAGRIHAEYISIDGILEENDLWVDGGLEEFLRANKIAVARATTPLEQDRPAILDGNFYWEEQLKDLGDRLGCSGHIFTLMAPLSVCIARDAGREHPHGASAAREVYRKSTRFAAGIEVDASAPAERVVELLASLLPRSSGPRPLA
ncbi:MAG TPA: AAA family ATPase [Thermoplasmata archaeon]|nr:AAA family ATPase [Thermoplasmata archaeon]